jgi:hypothetical protein
MDAWVGDELCLGRKEYDPIGKNKNE